MKAFHPIVYRFTSHALLWLLIAGIWFYLRHQDYSSTAEAAQVTFIKVIDLAAVVYLTNLLLVPNFLYRRRYLRFALLLIAVVGAFSYIKMVLLSFVTGGPVSNVDVKQAVYNNFVTQFFLVLASVGLKSAVDYIQLQKRMVEIAKEKAEAELAYLKAQINPHFLFNALNAVYFLIDKRNNEAREALHKFSDMLRYQLYECNDSKIAIEKEIGYLKDYVGIQQLRMNENTSVRFSCEREVANFSIEPLLLIPFVENSFKHLSHYSNGQKNEVQIKLSRENGSLLFSVYNTTEHKQEQEAGGIGLKNVQKRLELLYPGKHKLQVKEKQGWFGVELNLSLHQ